MSKGMSGWLAPSGAFYPCDWQEHYKLAFEIMNADLTLQRERIRLGHEEGTVISFDDALRKMDWIVMGCPPWSPSDLDYVFFPSDLTWERTQEQINWFEDNYQNMSEKQIEMLDEHIDMVLRQRR